MVYKAHFKRYESAETEVVAVKTLKGVFYIVLYGMHVDSYFLTLNILHTGVFTASDLKNITEEIKKMQGLDHPNVMTLLGTCLNASTAPCIVMPYMANGSLLSYIRRQKGSLVLSGDADITQVANLTVLLSICIKAQLYTCT